VVTIEEAGAPRKRELWLLVVGAAFSIGLGFIVDLGLRWLRGRRADDWAQ
jgi:hypothetical protein